MRLESLTELRVFVQVADSGGFTRAARTPGGTTNTVGRLIAGLEALSGLLFVGIALLGLVLAGGFLDNRILPLGTLGNLFSAGAIPLISALIGLKVGAEFSSILASLSEAEES